jgi:hypothetical protein
MKNKRIIWVGLGLFAVAGLGFLGYKMLKKSRTKSNDPEKNNRNVVQNHLTT